MDKDVNTRTNIYLVFIEVSFFKKYINIKEYLYWNNN